MRFLLFSITFFFNAFVFAQSNPSTQAGWLSFGVRGTFSAFDHDGTGIGSGGQFRVRLTPRVNTDWFGDYISINVADKVRSEYYHIGWSVVYYPFTRWQYPRLVQPYIVAGHCFDFNRKTALQNPSNTRQRWGSAVQAGAGVHFNLNPLFDISLTAQYMIHLTKDLEATWSGNVVSIATADKLTLEGHLLTTLSLNYKLARLWVK